MLSNLRIKGLVPFRAYIAVMIFSACFMAYVIRVHISINIIAMVKPNNTDKNITRPECADSSYNENDSKRDGDFGPRYDWDTNLQGLILSAFFWGYTIASLPGGLIAEYFGPRKTVLVVAFVSSVVTGMVPLAASWHWSVVIILRFIAGLVGGLIYPAMQCLIAHWAPPKEKGKFTGALFGSSLGTVATWPLLGLVIEEWGWYWAFYVPAIFTIIWGIVWFLVVRDDPEDHSWTSEEEKMYIAKELGPTVQKTKGLPPYKDIFTSVPFWAMSVLQFGNLWGLFFLMTAGPTFMSKVLGFNLKNSGFFSALPYIARMFFGFMIGVIADYIIQRKFMSRTFARKFFVLFSHILPGVFLFILTAVGCDIDWAIALITLSLGVNGASSVTSLQNAQDLAPNYAGSIYGIATCIGGTSGFISPLVVGSITEKKNGLAEWHVIFWIGASVYIACALVFLVFGSAAAQPWNTKGLIKSEKNLQEEESQKAYKDPKEGIENIAFQSTENINKDSESTKI